MSCADSFIDCVGSAPIDQPAFAGGTSNTIIFVINAALYLMNAGLIIWLVYNLVRGIYLMVKEDNQENFAVAKNAFMYSLVAAFGIILLQNANWIGTIILKTLGVPDGENVFLNLNLVGLN